MNLKELLVKKAELDAVNPPSVPKEPSFKFTKTGAQSALRDLRAWSATSRSYHDPVEYRKMKYWELLTDYMLKNFDAMYEDMKEQDNK